MIHGRLMETTSEQGQVRRDAFVKRSTGNTPVRIHVAVDHRLVLRDVRLIHIDHGLCQAPNNDNVGPCRFDKAPNNDYVAPSIRHGAVDKQAGAMSLRQGAVDEQGCAMSIRQGARRLTPHIRSSVLLPSAPFLSVLLPFPSYTSDHQPNAAIINRMRRNFYPAAILNPKRRSPAPVATMCPSYTPDHQPNAAIISPVRRSSNQCGDQRRCLFRPSATMFDLSTPCDRR